MILILKIGGSAWPYGCQLKYVNGYDFINEANGLNISSTPIQIKELEPNESVDISLRLVSPNKCDMYQCQLRFYTQYDQPFGDPIWIVLNVEEGGILGITQQLNNVNMMTNPSGTSRNLNINDSSNSKSPFKLDSNFNFVNNNNSSNLNYQEDEKRPDFYDDMFS